MKENEIRDHAKALSALGASKGGKARAEKLTTEERKEIASKAAKARWGEKMPLATHGNADHPVVIGDIAIPCYVLDDERRVFTMMGMVTTLNMTRGGGEGGSARHLRNS